MSFICKDCQKVFRYKSKLEEHNNRKIACNAVKKDKNCNLCKANFNYKSDLDRHLESNKHKNNLIPYSNIEVNIELDNENNIKKIIQEEYNLKLAEELEFKNNIIHNLKKENDNLKYNFEDVIKFEIQQEVLELIPIFDKITTHKVLNKININDILTKYNRLLSITDLLYIINYDLNKLYIDKFWNNIESEDWIYLDEELIQWFGYKENYKGKEKIVKFLKNEFEIDEDYKILNNEEYINSIEDSNSFHSPVAGEWNYGNVTKHILMKPDCFKDICMSVGLINLKKLKSILLKLKRFLNFT